MTLLRPDVAAEREASLIRKVRAGTFGNAGERPPEPPTPPAPANRPDAVGQYRLLKKLGVGGIGEVWLAKHETLGSDAAVKLLRPEHGATEEQRRRFMREARAAAAVEHEHIVRVYDFGVAGQDTLYMVMEYLGQSSLKERLDRGPMAWTDARRILTQATSALAHAHAAGVIHLDLKPSNIMLWGEGDQTFCKVIDFGLAKCVSPDLDSGTLTQSGQVLGSPAYMSPEQFRGHRTDARSDVYSLACVAFHMLAGNRPYVGINASECMYQHLMAAIPELPPSVAPGETGRAISAVLARAMAKDPEQRFGSMEAFATALEQAHQGVMPSAVEVDADVSTRVEPGATSAKPRSSRWRIWGAAAVVMLAVGAGVLGILGAPTQTLERVPLTPMPTPAAASVAPGVSDVAPGAPPDPRPAEAIEAIESAEAAALPESPDAPSGVVPGPQPAPSRAPEARSRRPRAKSTPAPAAVPERKPEPKPSATPEPAGSAPGSSPPTVPDSVPALKPPVQPKAEPKPKPKAKPKPYTPDELPDPF